MENREKGSLGGKTRTEAELGRREKIVFSAVVKEKIMDVTLKELTDEGEERNRTKV